MSESSVCATPSKKWKPLRRRVFLLTVQDQPRTRMNSAHHMKMTYEDQARTHRAIYNELPNDTMSIFIHELISFTLKMCEESVKSAHQGCRDVIVDGLQNPPNSQTYDKHASPKPIAGVRTRTLPFERISRNHWRPLNCMIIFNIIFTMYLYIKTLWQSVVGTWYKYGTWTVGSFTYGRWPDQTISVFLLRADGPKKHRNLKIPFLQLFLQVRAIARHLCRQLPGGEKTIPTYGDEKRPLGRGALMSYA